MQDQRLVTRLQNYWELIRRGKPMPEIQQLNPGSIDDLWHSCMRLNTVQSQGGTSYTYHFMGENLIKLFGRDLTNTTVNRNMTQYPYNVIINKLDDVMAQKKCVIDHNQFVNDKGRVVKYRACFLPFGNDAKGITNVVVGISDREF